MSKIRRVKYMLLFEKAVDANAKNQREKYPWYHPAKAIYKDNFGVIKYEDLQTQVEWSWFRLGIFMGRSMVPRGTIRRKVHEKI